MRITEENSGEQQDINQPVELPVVVKGLRSSCGVTSIGPGRKYETQMWSDVPCNTGWTPRRARKPVRCQGLVSGMEEKREI